MLWSKGVESSQLEGPGFDSRRGKLWALGACPLLPVISAHTLGVAGESAFLFRSLHVPPVSPRLGTITKNMQ